jgi:ParB-like chromosome segregation protein Spo0J
MFRAMVMASENNLDVDLHRLQLRFAATRVNDRRAIERLSQSIERCGQLTACVAVSAGITQESAESWVLIEGYRRVIALKHLGRDTARIQVWSCDLSEALLRTLTYAHGRSFDPIEEALLLQELVQGLGLTQHDVARRSGKDVSWVSRRLGLLTALPQDCLQSVRAGNLSCWSATRVLAPLARANTAHASALLQAIDRDRLSTRDLTEWFSHYQQAKREVRERMVMQPALFVKALKAREQEQQDAVLRSGPEGQCLKDMRVITKMMERLSENLAALAAQELSLEMLRGTRRFRERMISWQEDLRRYEHDNTANAGDRGDPLQAEQESARDLANSSAIAQHSEACSQEPGEAAAAD